MTVVKLISPERFIERFLGASYLLNGRDEKGIDCYGLVALWYRDVVGIELPDWERADKSRRWVIDLMSIEVESRLRQIASPRDHSIVIGQRGKLSHHVGVYWRGSVFHIAEGSQAMLRPLSLAAIDFGGSLHFGVPKID